MCRLDQQVPDDAAQLLLGVVATLVLLIRMQPISALADAVGTTTFSRAALTGLRSQVVIQTVAALVVLTVATALSVYKPPGRTRRGWRVLQEQRAAPRG